MAQSTKIKPRTDISCIFANKYSSRGNIIWRTGSRGNVSLKTDIFRKYTFQLNKVW